MPQQVEQPLELDKLALFKVLGYEPHAGQTPVHACKSSRRVLACGVRWGKSTCGAMEGVAALLAPRETSLGWIVAPTVALTDQVFQRIRFALHDKFNSRIVEDEERERRVVVRNLGGGLSEVQAKTGDNPVGLLGAALDWVIVDEAARLRRFVWEQVLAARLIDRAGWGLLLSTPMSTNWFWEAVRRGEKGRDEDFTSWRSPTWMNPYVSRDLIEAERGRLSLDAFAQEYEAQFQGEAERPCEVCKGPSPVAARVLILKAGEPVPRCPECRGAVSSEGGTVVSRCGDAFSYVKIRRVSEGALPLHEASAFALDKQDPQRN